MPEISNKYHVINRQEQKVYTFLNLDDAFKYYDGLSDSHGKELHVELPYVTGAESKINPLLKYDVSSRSDEVCFLSSEELVNPLLALAYSKVCIHCNPDDSLAWSVLDEAEKKLGVFERVVDHSEDLLVGYWRVHIIPTEGRYGKHNELINHGKPGIEFYDIRYTDNELAPLGLGIRRCYIDDLFNDESFDGIAFPNGFKLHSKIPNQTLSSEEMNKVVKYINDVCPVMNRNDKVSLKEQMKQAKEKASSEERSSKQLSRDFGVL